MNRNQRIPKTREERLTELCESLDNLELLIRDYKSTENVGRLRAVASILRALLIYETGSRSLAHPLLIEMARDLGFPLKVFGMVPETEDLWQRLGPILRVSNRPIRLKPDQIHRHEIELVDALDLYSSIVNGQRQSLKQIIRQVGDTESAHFDLGRPVELDTFSKVTYGELPLPYQVVFEVGEITIALGYKFIDRCGNEYNDRGCDSLELFEIERDAKHVHDAISTFQQARKFWSKDKFPQKHAGVAQNLGVAYFGLAETEDRKYLEVALNALEQALSFFDREHFPQHHGDILFNMAKVIGLIGNKAESFQRLHDAESAYRSAGAVDAADRVHGIIIHLEKFQ